VYTVPEETLEQGVLIGTATRLMKPGWMETGVLRPVASGVWSISGVSLSPPAPFFVLSGRYEQVLLSTFSIPVGERGFLLGLMGRPYFLKPLIFFAHW